MTQNQTQKAKPLPLEGVRVVDFSGLLPGPFATQMLSEFGADVIKVERPNVGDPSRHNYPRFRKYSIYFNLINGNKRSITLDLTKERGREVAQKLLSDADVVVEGYRPGIAAKLGVDYISVKRLNPRIIYCSISGFGQSGSLSHIAGHDLVVQGMAGVLGSAFDGENPPPMPSYIAADYTGSLMAIIGIQAALAQRVRTGEGCEIDISMFDALFNLSEFALTPALGRLGGCSGEPRAEIYGRNPRYATYLSKDKKPVAVSLLEAKAWRVFCESIGRPDLISKNETSADRLTAHAEFQGPYRDALESYCASHTWAEIMENMEKSGIAICPICSNDEAVGLRHVSERGLIGYVDHPVEGRVPQLINPLTRAGLAKGPHRPAPELGQHTDEILAQLGYSQAQIAALRDDKVT